MNDNANEEPFIRCSGALKQPPVSEERKAQEAEERQRVVSSRKQAVERLMAKISDHPAVVVATLDDFTSDEFWCWVQLKGSAVRDGRRTYYLPEGETFTSPKKIVRTVIRLVRKLSAEEVRVVGCDVSAPARLRYNDFEGGAGYESLMFLVKLCVN